jgi:hypothetical protein
MKNNGYERAWDRKVDARGILLRAAGLVARRRLPARRSAWVYRRAALVHQANLLTLAGALTLGLVYPSLGGALAVLLAEFIFLLMAPRSRWISARLDADLAESEAQEAQEARAARVARMSDGHRKEFDLLDLLVKRITAAGVRHAPRAPLADGIDPHELVDRFIRLALAHRACDEALEQRDRGAPHVTLRALEVAHRAASPQLRVAIAERFDVIRRRTAFEASLRENSDILAHQLATISELIQLCHQQTLTAATCAESTDFAQQLVESRAADRELEELDGLAVAACEAPGALPATFA